MRARVDVVAREAVLGDQRVDEVAPVLAVSGIDLAAIAADDRVSLLFDGELELPARYGLTRTDVARILHQPGHPASDRG
jgi:hypothetical protein